MAQSNMVAASDQRPLCADCVEKLICASERERLIQDQVLTRNNDSRIGSPRFLYCRFPLHSAQSATFSTQSVLCGRPDVSRLFATCRTAAACRSPFRSIPSFASTWSAPQKELRVANI